MKDDGNPHYSGKRVDTICPICGTEFGYYPSMRRRVCCSRACAAEYRRRVFVGEKHARWKGGANEYYGPNWPMQREATLRRDSYTCQHCGKTQAELGREPDVHHLKPLRVCADFLEANALENLIALCSSCHHAAEYEAWEAYGGLDTTHPTRVPPGFVTPDQAAESLGLHVNTIYQRIRLGKLHSINLCENTPDRQYVRHLIPVSELERTPPRRPQKRRRA